MLGGLILMALIGVVGLVLINHYSKNGEETNTGTANSTEVVN